MLIFCLTDTRLHWPIVGLLPPLPCRLAGLGGIDASAPGR